MFRRSLIPFLLLIIGSTRLSGQSASLPLDRPETQRFEIHPLKLERALPVDGEEGKELSGLAICDGELYTISDVQDDRIFRIRFSGEQAVLESYLEFVAPPMDGLTKLDLEGLTCDDEGNFYLVSESACRILKVGAGDRHAIWITPSLLDFGSSKNLFQRRNAYLEGIALVAGDEVIVAAERQNRGLMRVKLPFSGAVEVLEFPVAHLAIPWQRSPDLSDLTFEGDQLYGLIRAASALCRLDWEHGVVTETQCWSFETIENLPELQYENMRYGRGEGLAIEGDTVYVVLDNNQEARKLYPDDYRPLLLIMKPDRSPAPLP